MATVLILESQVWTLSIWMTSEGSLQCKSPNRFNTRLTHSTNSHHTRELPYSVPFRAKIELIHRCFEGWGGMANDCAKVIIQATLKIARRQVDHVFGSFSYAELDRAVE